MMDNEETLAKTIEELMSFLKREGLGDGFTPERREHFLSHIAHEILNKLHDLGYRKLSEIERPPVLTYWEAQQRLGSACGRYGREKNRETQRDADWEWFKSGGE